MALLSVIRRWALRDRIPIREISRRTGLSRNTIRKYLRSDEVEPRFKAPDRPSKLDPFAEKLAHWLRIESGRSRKQKRTLKQLYGDLVALGYDGSYNRVALLADLRALAKVEGHQLQALLEEAVGNLIAERQRPRPDVSVKDALKASRRQFDPLYKKLAES